MHQGFIIEVKEIEGQKYYKTKLELLKNYAKKDINLAPLKHTLYHHTHSPECYVISRCSCKPS